jgi:hypothetical protein
MASRHGVAQTENVHHGRFGSATTFRRANEATRIATLNGRQSSTDSLDVSDGVVVASSGWDWREAGWWFKDLGFILHDHMLLFAYS